MNVLLEQHGLVQLVLLVHWVECTILSIECANVHKELGGMGTLVQLPRTASEVNNGTFSLSLVNAQTTQFGMAQCVSV